MPLSKYEPETALVYMKCTCHGEVTQRFTKASLVEYLRQHVVVGMREVTDDEGQQVH